MNWKKYIILVIIIIAFLWLYNYTQISKFYINKVKLTSNKINKTLKITQITDFHSNNLIDLDKMFIKIKEFSPDIIVLTGDIIDYKTTDLALALDLVKRTRLITPNIYFVSGNHETNHMLEKDLYKGLEEMGVTILNNTTTVVDINGERINLLGASFFAERSDFDNIFNNIEEANYNVLLSHSPNRPITYLNSNIDLILSGHTHGGQVRLPIIGAIIAPGQGLLPKYDKGLIQLGETTLYIDSGLGNSVANVRLFNPVQFSNIEVEPIE